MKKALGEEEVGVGGGGGGGVGSFSAVSVGTAEPHQWAGKTFIHRVHGNRREPCACLPACLPGERRVGRHAEFLSLLLPPPPILPLYPADWQSWPVCVSRVWRRWTRMEIPFLSPAGSLSDDARAESAQKPAVAKNTDTWRERCVQVHFFPLESQSLSISPQPKCYCVSQNSIWILYPQSTSFKLDQESRRWMWLLLFLAVTFTSGHSQSTVWLAVALRRQAETNLIGWIKQTKGSSFNQNFRLLLVKLLSSLIRLNSHCGPLLFPLPRHILPLQMASRMLKE